eukprot:NODE_11730_length_1268_cov_6.441718.p2 GENE.NODE_11730_length_1268_cov_6.441718~~NODE_11730_length_1268_cov_6.441718.p2  ORF type:complete len:403 (-),score=151.17 NODE_11730_length_1268_cov_6.441718:58-1185(-)
MAMTELQKGLPGTYYPRFPVLGVASNGGDIFLLTGGGGATASGEVPNLVQAFRYDEATKELSGVASLSTDKVVCVGLEYVPAKKLYLAPAGTGTKVIELNEKEKTLEQVNEWSSEEVGKEPVLNIARCSKDGNLCATGGTDKILKLWRVEDLRGTPELLHSIEFAKEILDVDFDPDGGCVVAVDRSGLCRVHFTSSGKETATVAFPKAANPQKQVTPRRVRFATSRDSAALVVAGSGVRGPAVLAIFTVQGRLMKQVQIDKLPLTALTLDASTKHAAVCLVSGDKRVYSVEGLKCLKSIKGAHELPASGVSFVGERTVVSGSGDRVLNIMDTRGGGGGGAVRNLLLALIFFALIAGVLFVLTSQVKDAPGKTAEL